MFDIDIFDVPTATISSLKSSGKKVICYFSAGSYEDWRPDAKAFPAAVLGKTNGWPGEKWLDVRNITALGPIMEARLDLAVEKGCDGVEPDNIDGYTNSTGFPLTAADQIAYNKWLAAEAHERNLSIGLKNDLDQVVQLEAYFDWALNEQCFQYNECDALLPFVQKGKAVFITEYSLATSQFCSKANSMGFMAMKKNLDLDASRTVCWNETALAPTPAALTAFISGTLRTSDVLNVRSAPSRTAAILGTAAKGMQANVISSASVTADGLEWLKVVFETGLTGWSAADWLK